MTIKQQKLELLGWLALANDKRAGIVADRRNDVTLDLAEDLIYAFKEEALNEQIQEIKAFLKKRKVKVPDAVDLG